MEDKKISEMAELLFKGVKMLSHHCPECGVPLFQDGDRIFCPSCGRDVVFESDLKSPDSLSSRKGEDRDTGKSERSEQAKGSGDGKAEMKIHTDTHSTNAKAHQVQTPQETKGSGSPCESLDQALSHLSRAALKLCRMIEEENDFSLLEKKVKTLRELTESADRLLRLREILQWK